MKKLLVFTLLAAAAAGVYLWHDSGQAPALAEKDLTFANLQFGTMRDVVSATGLVEPREVLVVGSEVPGTVTHLLARVNDLVAEGAELAILDDRKVLLKVEEARTGVAAAEAGLGQARAALTQARASREAAEAALKYQQDLATRGGFRSDRDQAEAQARAAAAGVEAAAAGLAAAQARLQAAQTGLRDAELARDLTRVRVPEVGPRSLARREFLVLDRKAQEGQAVGPQAGPLFTLAGGLDHVEVHAQVVEGDVNKVRKGLPAVFTVTSFADTDVEFRGVVKDVRPTPTNIKGAVYYATVLDVANQKDPATGDWLLRPGMTTSVDIVRREHRNVWKVPSPALNFQLDEAYQTDAARARVADWRRRPDAADWQVLWTWDPGRGQADPLFVRVGGLKAGEPGLKDSEGNEVLEWAPGQEPTPQAPPRVLIGAPPARAPGFFDQPANIKVS